MLQIFFKTSQIKAADWARVYPELIELATNFPVQLLRIESYNGYEKGLDKIHENLICDEGKEEEHLSVYSDKLTQSGHAAMTFYRDWELHKKKVLVREEANPNRPISWFPPQRFLDDGNLPEVNGQRMHSEFYLDPEGVFCQYAMAAFGIFLENELPGRVLYIGFEMNEEAEKEAIQWLEGHFRRNFSLPLYRDKNGITDTFQTEYADEKDAVSRVEHLYRKQYLQNMQFSLERFQYDSVFRFYAEVLAIHRFGTYGFHDVLNAWIAAVQDLEKVLNLLAESAKIRVQDRVKDERETEEAYDYVRILRDLLDSYILWDATKREYLRQLPNNENFTQTGEQDLFGILGIIANSDEKVK